MADRGIIFSAPMVRALLDGRKAQTRRLCAWANNPNSPQLTYIVACDEPGWFGDEEGEVQFRVPYAPGDRLWVREAWSHTGDGVFEIRQARMLGRGGVIYRADDNPKWPHAKFWPSIHMPREFSRLTLIVDDVKVERLQDISEADARAEGLDHKHDWLPCWRGAEGLPWRAEFPVDAYLDLWDSLHTKPGERWEDNPWIVAVTFDVQRGNIDQLARAA